MISENFATVKKPSETEVVAHWSGEAYAEAFTVRTLAGACGQLCYPRTESGLGKRVQGKAHITGKKTVK